MKSALFLSLTLLSGTALAQFGAQPGYPAPVWSTVAQGENCAVTRPGTVIVSNQADWERQFRMMYGVDANTRLDIPVVANWNTQDIAIVYMGQVRTAGYHVYVETLTRQSAGALGIQWVVLAPPQGVLTAQVVCSPFCIVRIERLACPYQFFGRQMYDPYYSMGGAGVVCAGWAPAWRFGQGGLTPLAPAQSGHHRQPQAWRFGQGGLTPLYPDDNGNKGDHRGQRRDNDRGGRDGGGGR